MLQKMNLIVERLYNHISFVFPDIIPGATDRAGFIDTPVMGPAKVASNKIVAPIEIPASTPTSLEPNATFRITIIKRM